MSALRRIGIYGGTFDPVHRGHVEIARRVLELFELDEVVFMPAYEAPHKTNAGAPSPFHRFAMLALATAGDECLRVSTIELDAPEHPYTVETITRMQEQAGRDRRLFFVMGADSWQEVTTWQEWERLLQLCDHIVVTRPGYDLSVEHVPESARNVFDVRGLNRQALTLQLEPKKDPAIFMTDAVMLDISATDIRAAARAGDRRKLETLVPPTVVDYIEKYGLYQNL